MDEFSPGNVRPVVHYAKPCDDAARLAAAFASATPFPHVVIDDFLTPPWPDLLLDEFPAPSKMEIRFQNEREVKSASSDWERMGMSTRAVIGELNSGPFITFVENVTGVAGLLPDPHLFGGGLHQIEAGGKLGIHADFNWYERLRLERRLNILIYLNKEWQADWGGALELWDPAMTSCVKSVSPTFNRCVLFATDDFSFHGHPDPLRCPESVTRKSLALYYYSNGRPGKRLESPHSTLFQRRPGTNDVTTRRPTTRNVIRSVTPPLALHAARTMRQRWRTRRMHR